MIRISTIQGEEMRGNAFGSYIPPTCRIYGLRLRSTVLSTSDGDIPDIDDDGEI